MLSIVVPGDRHKPEPSKVQGRVLEDLLQHWFSSYHQAPLRELPEPPMSHG